MMKLRLSIPILLFLIGILSACTQNNKDADVEADIAEIRQVMDRYLMALNTDDLELFMTCWADDAKRMEPESHVIVGKDKIEARFKIFFDNLNMDIALYGDFEVGVADDLGYSLGNFILSSSPKEGGPTSFLDMKASDIFKRQTDDSWKIYIDHFSPNPVWSNDSISDEMLEKQDLSDPTL